MAAVIPRLLASATLLLAVMVVDAAGVKPKPARPTGKSIEVEVKRGDSVRIPLRGYERNLNRLEYRIIGSPPSYGRLSNLTQYNGPERRGPGHVTYTPGDDEDSTTDSFAFEVKAPLTKLTGRGHVTIRIVDKPAQLKIAPSTLDFGAVAIGDAPARLTVELANVGGGVVQGLLKIPEPFALADDGMFVLRRGEKTRIPVIFAPQRADAYLFPIQPVPGDPAVLTLKGTALQPFAVEAPDSVFQEQPDQSRTAYAMVKNQSQSPQQISVILPPEVPVEPLPPLDIAPGEIAKVALRVLPATKSYIPPFDVRFETAAHSVALKFQAPPIPAELVPGSKPDFGPVKTGTAYKASLILSNTGGAVANCRLQSANGLTPDDGTSAFSVAPGTAHTVALKLMPKKDQELPTNVIVTFGDRKLSIPVVAAWATAETSPTPTPVPTPTPPGPEFTLDKDIKLERKNGGFFIACREQQGWTNLILQHRPGGTGEWQDYRPPEPHEGLLGWIKSLARRIQGRLDTPIKRVEVEGVELEERFVKFEIAADEIDGPDVWRLFAAPTDGSSPRPVSEDFQIKATKLVPATVPTSPPPPLTPDSATASAPKPDQPKTRAFGPVTEIASAGIKSERTSALLQIALKHDPGIRGFRLERGSMVSPIDPKTGIPQAPNFEKIDPPQAKIELLGLGPGEAEGKKFTVCMARLSDLPAGSRTYWRLVPEGKNGDLPPTTVLFVDTLLPPPLPWNTVLLVALILLLGGVLYLRWKINRPPP